MASNEKPRTEETAGGGFTGWVDKSFTRGLEFSKKMSTVSMNVPFMFFEAMGVPEEKTAGLKKFNDKLIDGVYDGADAFARTIGRGAVAPFRFVGGLVDKLTGPKPEPVKAPKAQAKKAEGKKAKPKAAGTKKAPVKKKAPPKAPAVEAEPETKIAA